MLYRNYFPKVKTVKEVKICKESILTVAFITETNTGKLHCYDWVWLQNLKLIQCFNF